MFAVGQEAVGPAGEVEEHSLAVCTAVVMVVDVTAAHIDSEKIVFGLGVVTLDLMAAHSSETAFGLEAAT